MHPRRLLAAALLLATPAFGSVSAEYQNATQVRLDKTYAVVVFADGTKRIVPLASLQPEDLAWLTELSNRSPLARGKSQVTVAKAAAKATIQVAKSEGPLETVQLCPPNIMRDQIGGTCMLYARIHWLDIAGHYTTNATIYKIINNAPSEHPWQDPRYVRGLQTIFDERTPAPRVHWLPPQEEPFEWVRKELRKGRPILASLPKEMWQALPPGFVAAHPWNGGSVGHQIVINGFTWNKETRKGTFHVINSWVELPEFDLDTEAAKGGALIIEQSLSPNGEPKDESAKEIVKRIVLIKSVGKVNLYEVQTNLGTRQMLAASEDAVRALVEEGS